MVSFLVLQPILMLISDKLGFHSQSSLVAFNVVVMPSAKLLFVCLYVVNMWPVVVYIGRLMPPLLAVSVSESAV